MSRFCGKEPLFWESAQTDWLMFVYVAQYSFDFPVQTDYYLSVADTLSFYSRFFVRFSLVFGIF